MQAKCSSLRPFEKDPLACRECGLKKKARFEHIGFKFFNVSCQADRSTSRTSKYFPSRGSPYTLSGRPNRRGQCCPFETYVLVIYRHCLRIDRQPLLGRRLYEERLLRYIVAAWPVVEPATAFLLNSHIELIAEYLEAVTSGEIKRLLQRV
jgi:hypothetical protein